MFLAFFGLDSLATDPRFTAGLHLVNIKGVVPQYLITLTVCLNCRTVSAGPDGSFGPVVVRDSDVLGWNPSPFGYVSSMLCMYSVPYSAPNSLKAWSVQYCLWYCTL